MMKVWRSCVHACRVRQGHANTNISPLFYPAPSASRTGQGLLGLLPLPQKTRLDRSCRWQKCCRFLVDVGEGLDGEAAGWALIICGMNHLRNALRAISSENCLAGCLATEHLKRRCRSPGNLHPGLMIGRANRRLGFAARQPSHLLRPGKRTNSSRHTRCLHISGSLAWQKPAHDRECCLSVASFDFEPQCTSQRARSNERTPRTPSAQSAWRPGPRPGLWFQAELLRMSSSNKSSTKGSSSCHILNCCSMYCR